MKVVRASISLLPDAQLLLREYYDAVNVTLRDTPAEVEQFLSGAPYGFWIAYVEEIPAGCVVLRPLPSISRATECKRLYVRSRFRGQGIAGALLDAMEEFATLYSDWVYLDSKEELQDAIRLYTKRGYQPCERYNDNPQATVFLRKAVRPAGVSVYR